MRKLFYTLIALLVLTGATSMHDPNNVRPPSEMLNPTTVSCMNNSNDVSYDPSLEATTPEPEPEIIPRRDIQLALARICVSESG